MISKHHYRNIVGSFQNTECYLVNIGYFLKVSIFFLYLELIDNKYQIDIEMYI